MKIAYSGIFLEEGFERLNIQTIPFSFLENKTMQECLEHFEQEHGQPDLVFFDFLGIPLWTDKELYTLVDYPVPIAVYGADSSINIYHYKYCLKFFDYVFVDQKASVAELKKFGINAHWLPLCVNDDMFRKAMPKTRGASFVGSISKERAKRGYLLNKLCTAFPKAEDFQIFTDVSQAEMQDIFASSLLTINENLFSGLTLRALQALASGTLLLNESEMDGLEDYFEEGKHLLYYTPDNIINLMQDVFENPDKYQKIALQGQELCWQKHRTKERAREFLEILYQENKFNFTQDSLLSIEKQSFAKQSFFYLKRKQQLNNAEFQNEIIFEMLYANANSLYKLVQVHGGTYQVAIQYLTYIIDNAQKSLLLAKTHLLLAYIYSNCSSLQKAEENFLTAFNLLQALYDKHLTLLGKNRLALEKINQEQQNQELEEILKTQIDLACNLCVFYLVQADYTKAFRVKDFALLSFKQCPSFLNQNITHIFPSKNYNFAEMQAEDVQKANAYLYFSMAQIQACLGNTIELGYNIETNMFPKHGIRLAISAWKASNHSKIMDFLLDNLSENNLAGQILPLLLQAIDKHKVTKTQKEKIYAIAKAYYSNLTFY